MRENLGPEMGKSNILQFGGGARPASQLTEINTWSDFVGEVHWVGNRLTVSLEGPDGACSWTSAGRQTLIFAGELHAADARRALAGLTQTAMEAVPLSLSQLSGGFALVLLMPRTQSVLLATDPFGVRPLYYWSKSGRTVFSTRLDLLLERLNTSLSINWRSVSCYLNFTYVPGPDTIYQEVSVLSPGSLACVQRSKVEMSSYWDLQYTRQAEASLEELTAALRREIDRAIYQSLPVDLSSSAIGAFLSGGTDSGTIAGIASQSHSSLNAYSIGFHEGYYNEIAYAKRLAQHFGLTHHIHYLTADELLESIPILVRTCDQPLGNISLVAAWRCARLAAENGTEVLLAGDGGDELFGGNERYSKDHIYSRYHHLPSWTRQLLISLVEKFPTNNLLRNRLYNFAYRGNLSNPERFYMDDAFVSKWGETLMSPELCQRVPPSAAFEVVRNYYERADAQHELDRLLYVDLKMAIWGNDLPKVLTAARSVGLRVRFPFLDPQLAAFTGTLPASLKVRGLKKRFLFKRAVADLLPSKILQKPKKGFGVPIAEWIRTNRQVREAVLDPILDSKSFIRECVTSTGLHSIVEKHLHGRWNYGGWLWATMMLERWLREKRTVQYTCLLLGILDGEMVPTELRSA